MCSVGWALTGQKVGWEAVLNRLSEIARPPIGIDIAMFPCFEGSCTPKEGSNCPLHLVGELRGPTGPKVFKKYTEI